MIRLLQRQDLPDAMRLKDTAGWNQTEDDWLRLLTIEPEGCFAIEQEERVVATTTAICYGLDLAWVGMVLTSPEFRGRGFARKLMEHTLGYLTRRGMKQIGLDATDMGIPLYRSLGFQDECPISRFGLARKIAAPSTCNHDAALSLPGLDREAYGADRREVLVDLARLESASIPDKGFATGRPGSRAAYFGPCLSRDQESARRLLHWFLSRHSGEDIYWDLLLDNKPALELAQEAGFQLRRTLTRMKIGGGPSNPSLIYALAGLELG